MAPRINVPPVTRGLLVGLVVFTILNQAMINPVSVAPFLTIVPIKSVWYPWTMLTAAFVEENIISFTIGCVTIFFGGRYLERAWGSAEYIKFVLFVTMIPNIVSFVMYCLLVVGTGEKLAQMYVSSITS